MRALHIIGGPPGAGKTSSAGLVVDTYQRGVHIRSDDFWHYIASAYVEPWLPASADQNAVVMSAVASAAARFVIGNYDTIVDGAIGPWFLDPFIEVAKGSGFVLDYVILRPDREVALARALKRVDGGLKERGPVLKMHEEFSSLAEFERYVLDSSAMSPEGTAAALRSGLEEGRFRVI
ncbi:MAG TPA: zeta toxin family protein [Actinomycetota bacterium]|nr:zeta toxin family protein [Actinomycetota bacterium]